MALTLYERDAQRDIQRWQQGDESLLRRIFDLAMTPVDWATEQAVSAQALDQFDRAVERFFAGLGVEEVAETLGISTRTVRREWALARAWLHRELGPGE